MIITKEIFVKKTVFILLSFILFISNIYTLDISLLGQLGAGTPILRSPFATVQKAVAMQNGDFGIKSYQSAIFNTQGQVMSLFEFNPFFAMELGLGLRYSQQQTSYKNESIENSTKFQRFDFTVPVNFRVQYSYSLNSKNFEHMITYASIGPKISVPFLTGYTEDILGSSYEGSVNSVNIDLSFSLGQEIKVIQDYFVGIRVSYDLNLIDTVSESLAQRDSDTEENFVNNYGNTYHDDFTVYLTFRKVL